MACEIWIHCDDHGALEHNVFDYLDGFEPALSLWICVYSGPASATSLLAIYTVVSVPCELIYHNLRSTMESIEKVAEYTDLSRNVDW